MNEIERLLRSGHAVIAVRDHPELARQVQRCCADGRLTRFARGVYLATDRRSDPEALMLAAAAWAPDGVLTGRAAARLTFWPELAVPQICMSIPTKRTATDHITVVRERIPPELTLRRGPLLLTVPALTALDLVSELGGAGIDNALRRDVKLAQMHQALELTLGRQGNAARRALLHDSRDTPWSEAERLLHALLRAAGIRGWRANIDVWVGPIRFSLDALFDDLLLGIEIDGYNVHGPHQWDQFQRDRRKWSVLTSVGWRILHFTWHQLCDEPEWVVATVLSSIDLVRAEKARGSVFRKSSGR